MTHRHILSLQVENIMRLKAVNIKLGGGVVVIGGANAQGKTSLLDSISMTIGGKRLCPKDPIRAGETEGHVKLQLGELECVRHFVRTETGTRSELTVRGSDGAPLKGPQGILDELVGYLAFDPLEFARMSKKDAAAMLRELVGLDVEQLEEELERVFARRTEKGQEKRASQAVVDDMPWFEDIGERRSVAEIGQRMAAAAKAEGDRQQLLGIEQRLSDEIGSIGNSEGEVRIQIQQWEKAILEARERLTELGAAANALILRAKQATAAVEAFIVPDVEAIEAELAGVEKHNQKINANEKREERASYAEMIAREWKSLDQQHEQIATNIRKQTEAVTYPIEGLELRRDGVYFQDVPFEQGSRAERIKVSLAMGMALNEEMAVLLIRDGSVLDQESMRVLQELAEARDFQIWVEMARGYGDQPGAIVISDGEVVS